MKVAEVLLYSYAVFPTLRGRVLFLVKNGHIDEYHFNVLVRAIVIQGIDRGGEKLEVCVCSLLGRM